MGKVTKIVNASKRTGEKNGKTWNIMSVEVDDNGSTVVADSFDKLEVGSEVVLSKNDYGYSAKLNRGAGASSAIMAKLDIIEKKLDKLMGTDSTEVDEFAGLPRDW